MKILYYSPHPNLALNSNSGYGTHMREMIAAFRRADHTVEPFIMGGLDEQYDSSAELSKKRKALNIIKNTIPNILWQTAKDLRLIKQDKSFERHLREKIKNFEPDLIYERASYLQPSGVRAAKKEGIPHILEVNSPDVEEKKTLSGGHSLLMSYAARIEQELLETTDVAAVITTSLKEYFDRKYESQKVDFVITPNAINKHRIQWKHENVEIIRTDYELTDSLVLGFVGSLLPWHGVDLILKAFKEINRSHHFNIKVLIVGDGEGITQLKNLSREFEIDRNIIFTGRVPHDHVFDYIEAMDITIYPGSKENKNWYGSPVKLFEYGAMGKPIIIYDQKPIRDVMVHDIDGILIEPEVDQLVSAIRRLIENEELRKRMGKNFQSKVLNEYTWDKNVERVLSKIQ